MPRAKTFFYVCAGVFLLAGAHQFWATPARGQLAGTISAAACAPINGSGAMAAVGRTVWRTGGLLPTLAFAPVPGTDPIIAVGYIPNGQYMAMLANGDTYAIYDSPGQQWQLLFNAIGSATSATQSSWGQVKARYR